MNSVNVSCTAESLTPSACVSGRVKSVHAYCRLAIAIMAITPAVNSHQRLRAGTFAIEDGVTTMAFPPGVTWFPYGAAVTGKMGVPRPSTHYCGEAPESNDGALGISGSRPRQAAGRIVAIGDP